ncbi:hypothetical protein BSFA1_82740 (plasmid) [Burkholderia sp. SFA1]|nr:hypothetical protein BSFA1_82740 [Burkholderia sp. SFA1]
MSSDSLHALCGQLEEGHVEEIRGPVRVRESSFETYATNKGIEPLLPFREDQAESFLRNVANDVGGGKDAVALADFHECP